MSLSKPEITSIIFEDIDATYGRGKYGEFTLIMNKKTGYMNATELCGGSRSKRPFGKWTRSKKAKELIAYVSKVHNIPESKLFVEILPPSQVKTEKNPYLTRGTYVHPDLIQPIAAWHSVEFGYKTTQIVNNYMIQEMLDEKRRQREEYC